MICFPLDNTDYTADSLGAWLGTRTRGVFSADSHFSTSETGSFSVNVSGGLAWLKAAAYWGVVVYLPETQTLSFELADGSIPRWDMVCLRLDKNMNQAELVIKKGSYAQAPAYPAITRDINYDEIYLAAVKIRAGATTITASDIVDLRLNETYCGIMRDGVTGSPTQTLYDQWQSWFNENSQNSEASFNAWFEHIKDQLSEDAAGNLQSQIDTVAQNAVNAIGQVTATDDTDADGALIRFSLVQDGFKLFNGAKVIIYNPVEHSGKRLTLNVGETGDYPIKTYDSAGEHIWGLGGVLSLVYYDGVYYAQGLQETVFNAENIGGEPASNIPKLDATNTFVGNQKISNGNLAIRYAQLSSTGTQELSITADGSLGWGSIKLGVKTDWSLYPSSDNSNILGHPNNRWRQLYCANSTISTSDRTQKKDIEDLEDDFVVGMIENLKPSQYKMIDGTSDRTHVGFIAQDIEELLHKLGKTSLDFAGFIKSPVQEEYTEINENGEKVTKYRDVEGKYVYGLRYEEFIALHIRYSQIKAQQYESLLKRVEVLEKQ